MSTAPSAAGMAAHKVGERTVVVREITVAEIRAMASRRNEFNAINEGLFEEVSLFDLPSMTDLSMGDLDNFRPSELQEVVNHCKAMNPHFFSLLGRVYQMQKA